MNLFLGVLIILTGNLAFGETNVWYKYESTVCSEENSTFQSSDHIPDYSQIRFSVSIENLFAVQECKMADGSIRTVGLNLNKIGKNTYMVTPKIVEDNFVYFTIVVADDESFITTNQADKMQASCGGGLVVVRFNKDISATL